MVGETRFDIVSFTAPDKATAQRMARNWRHTKVEFADPKPVVLPANPKARRSFVFNPYYEVEALPLGALEEMNLFVTGMDWLTPTQLAVCTYTGEVWIVENATGPAKEMKFRRFARGMNEPMGLLVKDGNIHLGNKAEITRCKTQTMTVLPTCSNAFRAIGIILAVTIHSHMVRFDRQGNFVVTNAGHAGHWGARHMGWAYALGPMTERPNPLPAASENQTVLRHSVRTRICLSRIIKVPGLAHAN